MDVKPTTLHTILKKDLHLSKLTPKFVPRVLTEEQKCFRVRLCEENIEALKADPQLLDRVITGDESWISIFEFELKKDSKEWLPKGTTAQRPLKAIRNRSTKKVMVTVFFDVRGVVMCEFKPPGESITAETYCHTLGVLKERIRHKRADLWTPHIEEQSFILHHDNTPPHTAVPTLAFIGSSNINMLAHPPYSPDLAPCDFFLFPRLKAELRGHHHQNIEDLKVAVSRTLKAIPKEEYSQAIYTMPIRWMKCVKSGGQYFEGAHVQIDPEGDHELEMFFIDSEEEEN